MTNSNAINNPNPETSDPNPDILHIEKEVETFVLNRIGFSGPLPSPESLREYSTILPDAPDRIFHMAENLQNHYIRTEEKLVDLELKKVPRGQNHAFIIAIIGIIGAVVCAYLKQATIGSIIGGATLISLVPQFIYGERTKKSEKKENELNEEHQPQNSHEVK
ncbi:MAG: DUF2335 domain-containing protein [Candidatus Omnitrophota bacterium]